MAEPLHPLAGAPPSVKISDKDWPLVGGKPACFMGEFDLSKHNHVDLGPLKGCKVLLFSGLADITYKGEPMKEGHFVVLEISGNKARRLHDLSQGDDHHCAYSSQAEHERVRKGPKKDPKAHFDQPEWAKRFEFESDIMDVVMKAFKVDEACREVADQVWKEYQAAAGTIKKRKEWLRERLLPEFKWLKTKPRWIESEGAWPAAFGKQALFIGQVVTPENDVTAAHGCGGEAVYLFAGWSGKAVEFKILSQDADSQTAQEHYLVEELVGLYTSDPDSTKIISRCIKERDADIHGFMLGHAKTGEKALKELSAKGANKEIRAQAKELLAKRSAK